MVVSKQLEGQITEALAGVHAGIALSRERSRIEARRDGIRERDARVATQREARIKAEKEDECIKLIKLGLSVLQSFGTDPVVQGYILDAKIPIQVYSASEWHHSGEPTREIVVHLGKDAIQFYFRSGDTFEFDVPYAADVEEPDVLETVMANCNLGVQSDPDLWEIQELSQQEDRDMRFIPADLLAHLLCSCSDPELAGKFISHHLEG